MAFMAATSDNDSLRLEGLKTLELIIVKFANVPEPEFKDHVVLEQYQAQVGAALRPAFSTDTPPHVTAIACQVCSAWIGSGVARDLNDLKRVHQLLVSSLSKLQKNSSCTIYNESSITLEKLAILKAWAEVYIVAMKKKENLMKYEISKSFQKTKKFDEDEDEDECEIDYQSAFNEDLLQLVEPELTLLSENWLLALKDAAFLILPPEFSLQLPHDGGTFYTADTIEFARPQFRKSWSPILHAACLWFSCTGFDMYMNNNLKDQSIGNFHLLFGIAMEALCDPKSNEPISYITECLGSLKALLSHKLTREILVSAFDEAQSFMRYHPTKGYSWEFKDGDSKEKDSNEDKHKEKQKEEPSSAFQRARVDFLLGDIFKKFFPKVNQIVENGTKANEVKNQENEKNGTELKQEKVDVASNNFTNNSNQVANQNNFDRTQPYKSVVAKLTAV
ncbi:hypothetical protein RND71_043393 [Anisodus tanguticus]|uniref:Uncharacterized protein n=1 Tax=Anisodus tanguticus TaxID=243964 RepID=A0AAE1UTP7_9SOLA|nr:hypothetical protein RND71_043393 [Anisodus tanguticus]